MDVVQGGKYSIKLTKTLSPLSLSKSAIKSKDKGKELNERGRNKN
jgi:hypothetical protein